MRRPGEAGASARLPRERWFQAMLTEDLPPRRSTVHPPDDRYRLDHRPLYARDGGLGLRPGPHRRSAVPRGLWRGGVPGLAPGTAAPVRRVEVAVCATHRADG